MKNLKDLISSEIEALMKASHHRSLHERGGKMIEMYQVILQLIEADNYIAPAHWGIVRLAVSESVGKKSKRSYLDTMTISNFINICSVHIQ